MNLQLIRNATLRVDYAGHTLLIDPYFAPRHTRPSYTGNEKNPLVDLPAAVHTIIEGVELIIVSHLHSDHFDPIAQDLLPKQVPVLCQPGDEHRMEMANFQNIRPVIGQLTWGPITINRVDAQHGEGDVLSEMGQVSGFVFRAEGEPTLYTAGDTIWYEPVRETIAEFEPDVIVTHSSGAMWGDHGPIIMDAAQTVEVCRAAPNSTVVAVHLDSLDHGVVSRRDLRQYADAHGISAQQLRIPEDGETIQF